MDRCKTPEIVQRMKDDYYLHGTKFRRVFNTILQDVICPEPGFDDFTQFVSQTELEVNSKPPLDRQQLEPGRRKIEALLPLYREAFITNTRLQVLGRRLVKETGAVMLVPPLKKMWRSLEKMSLKYANDGDQAAARLKDIARLAIQGNMKQLLAVYKMLWEIPDVQIVSIENRFATPPPSGWADCQLMLTFTEDEKHHICEIQLVHPQLFLVRDSMGAHKEYVKLRCAGELLNVYGEPLPDLLK